MLSRACVAGVLAFAAVTASACGPARLRGGPASAASPVIAGTELERYPGEDVLALIQRLRPVWLESRSLGGQGPNYVVVVLDGLPQQPGLDPLRGLKASDVAEVRRLSASDATTRFGTGMPAGAILVATRH